MKKLALFISVIMLMILLAGCGGGGSASGKNVNMTIEEAIANQRLITLGYGFDVEGFVGDDGKLYCNYTLREYVEYYLEEGQREIAIPSSPIVQFTGCEFITEDGGCYNIEGEQEFVGTPIKLYLGSYDGTKFAITTDGKLVKCEDKEKPVCIYSEKEIKDAERSYGRFFLTFTDGTVGVFEYDEENEDGVWKENEELNKDISNWTDIMCASSRVNEGVDGTIGVKKDGTIVGTGEYPKEILEWSNVVYVKYCEGGTVYGLTKDGSVLFGIPDRNKNNTDYLYLKDQLSMLKNIVMIDIDYDCGEFMAVDSNRFVYQDEYYFDNFDIKYSLDQEGVVATIEEDEDFLYNNKVYSAVQNTIATDDKSGVITYIVVDDKAVIVNFEENSDDVQVVEIPEKIKKYPVIAIQKDAFLNCHFAELILPSSISYIEYSAVHRCSVNEIKFPNQLKFYYNNCCTECEGLHTYILQEGTKYIMSSSYDNAYRANYFIPKSVELISIGFLEELNEEKTKIYYAGTENDFVKILKRSNEKAELDDFSGITFNFNASPDDMITWKVMNNILTVSGKANIPDYTATHIGMSGLICNSPWANNKEIEHIVLEDGITGIGINAFASQFNVKDVKIPSTVTSIGDSPFYGCEDLTDIYFDGTKAQWDKIEMDDDDREELSKYNIHFS